MWPAGGKLIFSAFDRNQSVNALVRTLESAGQQRPGEGRNEGQSPGNSWKFHDHFIGGSTFVHHKTFIEALPIGSKRHGGLRIDFGHHNQKLYHDHNNLGFLG